MKGDSIGDEVKLEITIGIVNQTAQGWYKVVKTAYSIITDDKRTVFEKTETISGDAPDVVVDYDKKESEDFSVPAGFVQGFWNQKPNHAPVVKIERIGIKTNF